MRSSETGPSMTPDPVQIGLSLCLDGLKLPVQRATLADEDVPPPFGTLNSRLAEHVEQFAAGFWRHLLEVGAHCVEHGLASGNHVVADLLLLLERVALGRLAAEVCFEIGHVLRLLQGGPIGVAGVRCGHFAFLSRFCRPYLLAQGFRRSNGCVSFRWWRQIGDIRRKTSVIQRRPAEPTSSRNACSKH